MARKAKSPVLVPCVYCTTSSRNRMVHRLRADGNTKCGALSAYYITSGRSASTVSFHEAQKMHPCLSCFKAGIFDPDGIGIAPTTPVEVRSVALLEGLLAEAREYGERMHALAQAHTTLLVKRPPWNTLDDGVEIGKEEE